MANSTYGWTDDEKLRFYRQHGFWPNQAKFDASTLPGAPNTNTINTPYTQRLGSNTLGSGFSTMPKKRDFEGLFSFDPQKVDWSGNKAASDAAFNRAQQIYRQSEIQADDDIFNNFMTIGNMRTSRSSSAGSAKMLSPSDLQKIRDDKGVQNAVNLILKFKPRNRNEVEMLLDSVPNPTAKQIAAIKSTSEITKYGELEPIRFTAPDGVSHKTIFRYKGSPGYMEALAKGGQLDTFDTTAQKNAIVQSVQRDAVNAFKQNFKGTSTQELKEYTDRISDLRAQSAVLQYAKDTLKLDSGINYYVDPSNPDRVVKSQDGTVEDKKNKQDKNLVPLSGDKVFNFNLKRQRDDAEKDVIEKVQARIKSREILGDKTNITQLQSLINEYLQPLVQQKDYLLDNDKNTYSNFVKRIADKLGSNQVESMNKERALNELGRMLSNNSTETEMYQYVNGLKDIGAESKKELNDEIESMTNVPSPTVIQAGKQKITVQTTGAGGYRELDPALRTEAAEGFYKAINLRNQQTGETVVAHTTQEAADWAKQGYVETNSEFDEWNPGRKAPFYYVEDTTHPENIGRKKIWNQEFLGEQALKYTDQGQGAQEIKEYSKDVARSKLFYNQIADVLDNVDTAIETGEGTLGPLDEQLVILAKKAIDESQVTEGEFDNFVQRRGWGESWNALYNSIKSGASLSGEQRLSIYELAGSLLKNKQQIVVDGMDWRRAQADRQWEGSGLGDMLYPDYESLRKWKPVDIDRGRPSFNTGSGTDRSSVSLGVGSTSGDNVVSPDAVAVPKVQSDGTPKKKKKEETFWDWLNPWD